MCTLVLAKKDGIFFNRGLDLHFSVEKARECECMCMDVHYAKGPRTTTVHFNTHREKKRLGRDMVESNIVTL